MDYIRILPHREHIALFEDVGRGDKWDCSLSRINRIRTPGTVVQWNYFSVEVDLPNNV